MDKDKVDCQLSVLHGWKVLEFCGEYLARLRAETKIFCEPFFALRTEGIMLSYITYCTYILYYLALYRENSDG